jgi:hypothetical protein
MQTFGDTPVSTRAARSVLDAHLTRPGVQVLANPLFNTL